MLTIEYIDLDLDAKRLEMAKKLGADITIQVEKDKTAKEVASCIKDLLKKAPNKVIECSGAESSINTGIYVSSSTNMLVILCRNMITVCLLSLTFLGS